MASQWNNVSGVHPYEWKCSNCDNQVAGERGWNKMLLGSNEIGTAIRICPKCDHATIIYHNKSQSPASRYGDVVKHLANPIDNAYNEARDCFGCGAFTATALICRKILMTIAVEHKAGANKSFAHYVKHLMDNHLVPPACQPWVDHIRTKGNEATHELPDITREDAAQLIDFISMLLKMLYEYPSRLPAPPKQ